VPRPHNKGVFPSKHTVRQTEYVEELLRFAHKLSQQRDPEELLGTLPSELCSLLHPGTIALIYRSENHVWCEVIDGGGRALPVAPAMAAWQEEIWGLVSEQHQPLVLSSLDQEALLPQTGAFFREQGNGSLCFLPLGTTLRRMGALCIGRKHPDAFPEHEVSLLSLIADHAALVIDDWLNFSKSEAIRAQLESERNKLKLILDLNNSVVSNLELREVLQSISPSIRKVMRLDGVALMLPDAEGKHLQTHVLDFPNGKGVVQENASSPLEASLPGEVFRSGKQWVGDIHELRRSGFDHRIASVEGVETLCLLPLMRRRRVLGVLSLIRQEKDAFTQGDIEFFSQIAGQVAIAIDNALAYRQISELSDKLTQEKIYLEDEIRSEMDFEDIVGNSAVLRQVLRQVEAVAPTESAVLIHGETGTGKELIARAVHNLSQRHSHAFVKLNCAAIPTGLLESELFGHEKGAFTGAVSQRIGRFELASQGTIFLDEIGEIPLELQPKLLRVLQEREFERLGSSRTLRSDARLIAATNRDLPNMVEEQRFRSDLFYRLNVFPIHVPPLRERKEDIPFLVRHFAQHFARNMKRQIDTISAETMNALVHYPWPGNIRELQNIIERAVILSKGPVLKVPLSDLKPRTAENGFKNGVATLEEVERKHILAVLEQSNWVFAGPNGAAARLGIKRPTLQFRMQKLGISRPRKP
jgi:formate hydrogenlyase transcriptional activator